MVCFIYLSLLLQKDFGNSGCAFFMAAQKNKTLNFINACGPLVVLIKQQSELVTL